MISSKTKLLCLIGNPVEHSISPQMHNAMFKELNLDFALVSFKVEETELSDAVKGIRALGIKGGNVTLPHKTSIMKLLDEIDDSSKEVDSVNTFLNDNGILKGFNTDGIGALKALEENGISLKNKKVVIIGAGGASKSISHVVAMESPSELVILNRNISKAKSIADKINKKLGKKARVFELSSENLKSELKDTDILINCSSVGMKPNLNETTVSKEFLHKNLTVMDIIYNPLETRLLKEAKSVGAKTINGIGMLVNQGALAFEIWTGKKAPVELMRRVAIENLKGFT